MYSTCTCICILLLVNQILISKYLATRKVVVSGGWSNGSGGQQNYTSRHWRHSTMHQVPLVCGNNIPCNYYVYLFMYCNYPLARMRSKGVVWSVCRSFVLSVSLLGGSVSVHSASTRTQITFIGHENLTKLNRFSS